MADSPDNEVLSQDALDALMASVQVDEPNAAAEPAGDMIADSRAVSADALNDDLNETPLSGGGLDLEDESPAAAPATLKMSTFADPLPAMSSSGIAAFERVEDIPLELTVELGRTKLLIKDILDLGSGSIVELEKMVGEPVDLLANSLLIARGEVVVIEDNFGVRITEIITSAERKAMTLPAAARNAV